MLKIKNKNEIDTITSTVVNEIRKLFNEDIYKIILYGSYARGDFNIGSDIDIMIILNCSREKVYSYRKQASKISSRIGLDNDIEVSLLLRDRNTFEQNRETHPFYRNVQEEGISLYG